MDESVGLLLDEELRLDRAGMARCFSLVVVVLLVVVVHVLVLAVAVYFALETGADLGAWVQGLVLLMRVLEIGVVLVLVRFMFLCLERSWSFKYFLPKVRYLYF